MIKKTTGLELWRGESEINGDPIVVLANFKSQNRKTGPFVQVYILPVDKSPIEGIQDGSDQAVCGDCPKRRFLGGDCYVQHAHQKVWQAWQNGTGYPENPVSIEQALRGLPVRLTAYGDIRALPTAPVEEIKAAALRIKAY